MRWWDVSMAWAQEQPWWQQTWQQGAPRPPPLPFGRPPGMPPMGPGPTIVELDDDGAELGAAPPQAPPEPRPPPFPPPAGMGLQPIPRAPAGSADVAAAAIQAIATIAADA